MALHVSHLFEVIPQMEGFYVLSIPSQDLDSAVDETNISAFTELTGKCVWEGGGGHNKTMNKILMLQDNHYEGHKNEKEKVC